MIDLIQKSIEAESKRLSECEGPLRQYMSGGGLSFLVEWWEKEDLLLVENAHLLFIFFGWRLYRVSATPSYCGKIKQRSGRIGID